MGINYRLPLDDDVAAVDGFSGRIDGGRQDLTGWGASISIGPGPPATARGCLCRRSLVSIEVGSQPRTTPEGKAQADSKAQQPRQYVIIARGLQRRHRVSDGVMKPLLTVLVGYTH